MVYNMYSVSLCAVMLTFVVVDSYVQQDGHHTGVKDPPHFRCSRSWCLPVHETAAQAGWCQPPCLLLALVPCCSAAGLDCGIEALTLIFGEHSLVQCAAMVSVDDGEFEFVKCNTRICPDVVQASTGVLELPHFLRRCPHIWLQ